MSANDARCEDCDAPLAPELGGVCPACLWGGGDRENGAPPDLEFGDEIARGGMGVVYRARQRQPEREVAVKMLLPKLLDEPGLQERFATEARLAASLDHPAILPVYAVGESGGVPFFSMKLATGGSLADRLQEKGCLPPREAAALIADVAEAVGHAHSRGVLHRDLKPGNILFDASGRVFVSDFGLAKAMDAAEANDLTRTIALLGTPQYLPPEIARGSMREASTAGDIYALGAVLYELVSGRPPFDGDSMPGLLRHIADDDARPIEGLQTDLKAIIGKCMEKDPARRYAAAQTLADDLRAWLDGREVRARNPGRAGRAWRWARRNPLVATLAAGLACALIAGFALQIRANMRLSASLADALLAQASMVRRSSDGSACGQALALIRESQGRRRVASAELDVRRRSEAAAALALPSLVGEMTWRFAGDWNHVSPDFSPDLKSYAAPRDGGGFAIFDTATHAVLREFPGDHGNGLPAGVFAFDPTGEKLTVRFVDMEKDSSLTETFFVGSGQSAGRAETAGIGADRVQAISPDGRRLAFAMTDSTPVEIGISDTVDGRVIARLPGHGSAVARIAFHPNGRSVVSVGYDGWVVWQSIEPGGFRTRLPGNPGPLVFSFDGTKLGYSPARGSLGIADVAEPLGWRRWRDSAGLGTVTCAQASSQFLAIATLDGLSLWDHESGDRLDFQKWDAAVPVRWPWFRIAPDGAYLVCSDSHAPLSKWPIVAGRFGPPVSVVAAGSGTHIIHDFAADGTGWLVSGDREQRETSASANFYLWPVGEPTRARLIAGGARANGLLFVPPGSEFAVGFHSHQNDARIWDCVQAREVTALAQGESVFVNVSPDGARICTVGADNGCLWETSGWSRVATWSQNEQGKCVPSFSPDSKHVATVTPSGRVFVRASASGQLLLELAPPRDVSSAELVWTGNERIVLISGLDGIWEWNLSALSKATHDALR